MPACSGYPIQNYLYSGRSSEVFPCTDQLNQLLVLFNDIYVYNITELFSLVNQLARAIVKSCLSSSKVESQ